MIKILALLLFVAACGKDTQSISLSARHGSSCTVSPALDESEELIIGARIVCTDGSSTVLLNGADGKNGQEGIQGEPGSSCSVTREAGAKHSTISCPGSDPVLVHDGQDAEVESDGCTLTQNNQAQFTLTCGSVSVVFTTVPGQSGNSDQGNKP
jgi:hypothetical protein